MKAFSVRVNGMAPAWPRMLGQEHPFYNTSDPALLGSASYSLMLPSNSGAEQDAEELLIDAGHNTVPSLIRHGNKIPRAVILTHGHPDHLLGLDWIAQSLRFGNFPDQKLPVYCTQGVWDSLMLSWGHIEGITEHRLLIPGKKLVMDSEGRVEMTPFPVYHGRGAKGACMLYFEFPGSSSKPVIFTGDLLCPLLRKQDYALLSKAQNLFIDCNNRYPYPESNHISFSGLLPESEKQSQYLTNWLNTQKTEDLIQAHFHTAASDEESEYWLQFRKDHAAVLSLPHTICDLLHAIPVPEVYLVHYFGYYDRQLYGQELLSQDQLEDWASCTAGSSGLKGIRFKAPVPGQRILL